MSGSANSSVGSRQLYEANDQRTSAQDEINDRERFKEGQPGSHQSNDSKDQRSIANRLAREEQRTRKDERPYDRQAELSKKDPTLPAQVQGHEPSKGAKIDADLQADDEQRLREKGIKK